MPVVPLIPLPPVITGGEVITGVAGGRLEHGVAELVEPGGGSAVVLAVVGPGSDVLGIVAGVVTVVVEEALVTDGKGAVVVAGGGQSAVERAVMPVRDVLLVGDVAPIWRVVDGFVLGVDGVAASAAGVVVAGAGVVVLVWPGAVGPVAPEGTLVLVCATATLLASSAMAIRTTAVRMDSPLRMRAS